MQEQPDVRGEGTPDEAAEAGRLAIEAYKVLMTASTPKVRFAAAGYLLRMAFTDHIAPAMRIFAWEDYAYWTRRKIIEELGKRK